MKRISFAIVVLNLAIFWAACNKGAEKTQVLILEPITLRDSSGVCGDGNCFQADINYLTAKGGETNVAQGISDTIRKFVIRDILGFAMDTELPPKVEDALKLARTEYNRQVAEQEKEQDAFPIRFSFEIDTKETYRSTKALSIEQFYASYLGGAHPNSEKRLLVFDIHTAKIINLKNIVADSANFMKIVETYLRKEHEIPANQSLRDAGFFFDDNETTLPLPVDYAITANGLRFVYNPYEIAAYAMGMTEFEIPFAELEKVLKLDLLK